MSYFGNLLSVRLVYRLFFRHSFFFSTHGLKIPIVSLNACHIAAYQLHLFIHIIIELLMHWQILTVMRRPLFRVTLAVILRNKVQIIYL